MAEGTEGETASQASREHEVFVRDEGVVCIFGGKLTTYRRMAKEATDRLVEWLADRADAALEGREIAACRTKGRPLPGAQGIEKPGQKAIHSIAEKLIAERNLVPRIAEHLSQTYGVRASAITDATSRRRPVKMTFPRTPTRPAWRSSPAR